MDELFLLPPVPMVTPRAYWLAPRTLSSQFMVVRPSSTEFDRLMSIITTHDANQFDMDIVNNLYGNNGIITPHRPYDLLSGEFRADTHAAYLGSDEEVWDPISALKEAKFLHFSDWPYPKPWIEARTQMTDELKPRCHWHGNPEREDCRNQEVWVELYTDFARRREVSRDLACASLRVDGMVSGYLRYTICMIIHAQGLT